MDLPSVLKFISSNCLHGRPVPRSLEVLWEADARGQAFEVVELELMRSLDGLEMGYGAEDAKLSADLAANVKAHRRMFERLAFFAGDDDGGFLAFDFENGEPGDPPVVHLDSEGQYGWLGGSLGHALWALAEQRGVGEAAARWLEAHDLDVEPPSSVSMAQLPDLGELHRRWYEEARGEKRAPSPVLLKAAQPAAVAEGSPASWIGAPGKEVEKTLRSLLRMEKKASLENWMAIGAAGRVQTVWLHQRPATESLTVNGARFGMSRAEVQQTLGVPSKEGKRWVRYDRHRPSLHLEFSEDDRVARMTLMAAPP